MKEYHTVLVFIVTDNLEEFNDVSARYRKLLHVAFALKNMHLTCNEFSIYMKISNKVESITRWGFGYYQYLCSGYVYTDVQ